jgi:hypothetical protein
VLCKDGTVMEDRVNEPLHVVQSGGAELIGSGGDAPRGGPTGPAATPTEVSAAGDERGDGAGDGGESVEQPGKVMRIGSMVKQLLDEVRAAPLDEASRVRLREIYEQSVRELAGALSPDLAAELDRMALPFDDRAPSDAELRVAQAQLVGWLEGLFHGIQATLLAQQMAARAQLQEMRQRGLPPGAPADGAISRPGTYL